jgi:hypothetical protein
MQINSFMDLYEAYPNVRACSWSTEDLINRGHECDWTEREEREFIEHCRRLYEQSGFSRIFFTYDEKYVQHIGKTFTPIRWVTEDDGFDLEVLPGYMWIRLQCGTEICAGTDEIFSCDILSNMYEHDKRKYAEQL